MRSGLTQIEAAFADAPRPANDAPPHEQCMDDNDASELDRVEHWRDMPDELVETSPSRSSGHSSSRSGWR